MVEACIYYNPEAYTTSGPKLMGRNAAGESFLRGFASHSSASTFWVQVQRPEHARHFASAVSSFGRTEPVRAVDKNSLGALAQAGVVYYPGPGIGEHAFHRAAYGHSAWSLCGITHTTSSAGAMDALADLITSPVQPWDAVICTSTAVKDNVTRLLQAQVDYLQSRLGVSRVVLPLLPVIPLGIHTSDFVFSSDQKAVARAALGVSPDALVVLFMGRLSFHAKAHPLAMYQALEAAVQATGKSVVLVECGWHANEFIEKAYADAARMTCPSVRVVTLDGRKAQDRQTAWAGADVFCSLSDNIQETFGIVPIEAMAAGLPVEQEIADAKKSLAYWWYRCLQLSDAYMQCCEADADGVNSDQACADLYADMGDVRMPFARWWVKHGRRAFAEQKPLKQVLRIDSYKQADEHVDKSDRLVLSIPLTMRKTTAVRQVSKLLAQVHAQRDPVDIWKSSTAKRMIIKNKLRQKTIQQLLRLWELRQQDPDLSLYEIGKQAGIELDLLARDTQGEEITETMERRRMTIAVSRQLLQARHLIANAAQGVFPSLKPPAELTK